jgi:hypothetical protein
MFNPRKRFMVVVAFAIVLSLMVTGYAFAASNTVDPSKLGDGTGVISGYTITAVQYTLNGTNPKNVDSVSFTISPGFAGGVMKVQLVSGGSWFSCVTSGSPTITCALTGSGGVTALAADNLTVVSGQ